MMNWQRCLIVALAAPCALVGAAAVAAEAGDPGGKWTFSGSAAVEIRIFPEDAEFFGQDDAKVSPSVRLQPELRYRSDDGTAQLNIVPFGRWDLHDDHRSHVDLREASWLIVGDGQIGDGFEFGYDFVIGFSKVFWGVAESHHLIDIINQTDLVENVDLEDKLGQPMLNLNLSNHYGTLSAFVLPGFRERTFPDKEGRFRGPLPIAADNSSIFYGWREEVDFAGRYSHTISEVDFGVSHFHGLSREPRFGIRVAGFDLDPADIPIGDDVGLFLADNFDLIPDAALRAAADHLKLLPIYDTIDQTSLDAQLTVGNMLLKLEAMTRTGHGDRFYALVSGFEYTFFDLFPGQPDTLPEHIIGTNASLGLLAEYLFDTREECCSAPPTSFEDDVFMGFRLAFNGKNNIELLAGAILDVDTQASVFIFEFGQRISDDFKVEVESRQFINFPATDPLRYIEQDGYVTFRLIGFF